MLLMFGRRSRIRLPLKEPPWTLVSDPMPFLFRRLTNAQGSGVRGKPEPVLFEIFRFVARIPK